MLRLAALGLCVWLGLAGLAQAKGVALTPAEQAAVARALERGRLIYAYDQAAWHSTDALMRELPKAAMPTDGGWVVEPHGQDFRVTYFGLKEGTPYAVYQADMRGTQVVASRVFGEPDDRTLPAPALALARARLAARERSRDKPRCTQGAFNVVVAPPGADGVTPVYFLSSMVDAGAYPAGGHYEVDVAADGGIASERAFSKSCLTLNPGEAAKQAADPSRPPLVMVTHLLDATPTEIHVFLSLWMNSAVIVVTGPKTAWGVTGDEIRRLDLD